MQKIGKYEFTAEPFHCDFSGHLCLGHLGNNLLNAADFHATGRGFGMNHLSPQSLQKMMVLMQQYGMTPDDAYRLYGRYIGNWGDR